ncbi:tyrosine-type recombinase/integrase [Vagococcus fluvialis]|uniref:tyrosine-type recombinase/integrase n=1 Tax=Vagococcus fluvialis TaxID=2738 RepID=UPI003B5A2124
MKYDRAKKRYFDSVDYNVKKHVFVTRKGNKYSVDMIERDVKRIAVHAGVRQEVRVSPHTFRHYFTQSLVRYGTDIYTIQRLIGHSSIKTTEVYLNSLVDEVVIKKDYPQVH